MSNGLIERIDAWFADDDEGELSHGTIALLQDCRDELAKQAERVKALQNVLQLRINGDPFCFWCGGKDNHCSTCELAAVLREGKE